jgi:hypothetical protein
VESRENPTIILNGIGETRKGLELRAIELPDGYFEDGDRSHCVELAFLADHERQFKLWMREQNDPTFTDKQVTKLFMSSKFPNPAPIWNPKTQKYDVPWPKWVNEINKFLGK